jgi:hypothetical protein
MRDLCHTAGNLFIADTTLSDCPKAEIVRLSV